MIADLLNPMRVDRPAAFRPPHVAFDDAGKSIGARRSTKRVAAPDLADLATVALDAEWVGVRVAEKSMQPQLALVTPLVTLAKNVERQTRLRRSRGRPVVIAVPRMCVNGKRQHFMSKLRDGLTGPRSELQPFFQRSEGDDVDAVPLSFRGALLQVLVSRGDEVIHTLIDLMYAKAPYTVMQRAVHIHPTVSELLPTMLGELKPLH